MVSTNYKLFSKINKVSLGIDVFLWIQLIAVHIWIQHNFYHDDWNIFSFLPELGSRELKINGAFANLFTMTMLAIEYYGTSKKDTGAICISFYIRLHRIFAFFAVLSSSSLLGTVLFCNYFIFMVWDSLRILILMATVVEIRKLENPIFVDIRIEDYFADDSDSE